MNGIIEQWILRTFMGIIHTIPIKKKAHNTMNTMLNQNIINETNNKIMKILFYLTLIYYSQDVPNIV
jgi:hypothetical protein